MQKQIKKHRLAHERRIAWMTLVLTAIVLLTPGAVVEAMAAFGEPVIHTLRSWKDSWWPWPATDSTESNLAIDKIIHLLLFTACALLVTRAWHATLSAASILLLLLAFAVLTEIAQTFIPGRSMSLADIVADAVGAVLGTGFGRGYLLWRTKSETRLT